MNGSASKAKGRSGEREVAELITAAGFDAVRNERNGGGGEDVSHSIPGLWLEVKRTERLDLKGAMRQAEAGVKRERPGDTPAVVHRSNRTPWLITLPFEDYLKVLAICKDEV